MAKKDKQKDPNLPEELPEEELTETAEPVPEEPPKDEPKEEPKAPEVNWEEKYNAEHDTYLRLAAEFDNFRKRTTKEKEQSYGNGKSDAVAFLKCLVHVGNKRLQFRVAGVNVMCFLTQYGVAVSINR